MVEIDQRFTDLTGAAVGATYKKYVEGIALGRAQIPEDVAAFVSFLAGPDSDYMTGQAPLIDGGLVYRSADSRKLLDSIIREIPSAHDA